MNFFGHPLFDDLVCSEISYPYPRRWRILPAINRLPIVLSCIELAPCIMHQHSVGANVVGVEFTDREIIDRFTLGGELDERDERGAGQCAETVAGLQQVSADEAGLGVGIAGARIRLALNKEGVLVGRFDAG